MTLFFKRSALLLCLLLFFGCEKHTSTQRSSDILNYVEGSMWFDCEDDDIYDVDLFYILPTCIWDWQDSDGNICHYADINSSDQKAAMEGSYQLAYEIFAKGNCNFFAPYYRQISLESWMEGDSVVSERFPYAMSDIQNAFDTFISSKNGGRPFVLAGFSQGGKGVVELIKNMSEDVYERMVAAYVVGYRVTSEDMDSCEYLKMATDSIDTGVTICYNSVASVESIAPVLGPSAICINPVNWRTDETIAALNDSVTVRVDESEKVLMVEGLDSDYYYLPILEPLFTKGNYHLQELSLYKDCLKKNVYQRIKSFTMEKVDYMQVAINLSIESVENGGGPFGAVIVKDGEIISQQSNSVTLTNDPTAHAEVNAIRAACQKIESFSLEGCDLYTSCEPCPMCLGAAYWAGIKTIYFGNTREDAKRIDFDDSFIYDEIPLNPSQRSIPSEQLLADEAIVAFQMWEKKEDKIEY